jgi:hypothetical protein
VKKNLLLGFVSVALAGCAQELSVTERTETFDCAAAASCTYYVTCEEGETLTGGGFQLNEPGVGVLDIWENRPDVDENRWRVTTMNMETQTIKFSIYAMCGKLIGG